MGIPNCNTLRPLIRYLLTLNQEKLLKSFTDCIRIAALRSPGISLIFYFSLNKGNKVTKKKIQHMIEKCRGSNQSCPLNANLCGDSYPVYHIDEGLRVVPRNLSENLDLIMAQGTGQCYRSEL